MLFYYEDQKLTYWVVLHSGMRKTYTQGTNTLAYNKGPGPNAITLFASVIYKCLSQSKIFILGMSSLMFASEAGAYLNEEPSRCSTLG